MFFEFFTPPIVFMYSQKFFLFWGVKFTWNFPNHNPIFAGISVERSWKLEETVADAEGESPGNETTTILNEISSCESSTLNESDKA